GPVAPGGHRLRWRDCGRPGRGDVRPGLRERLPQRALERSVLPGSDDRRVRGHEGQLLRPVGALELPPRLEQRGRGAGARGDNAVLPVAGIAIRLPNPVPNGLGWRFELLSAPTMGCPRKRVNSSTPPYKRRN